MPGTRYQEHGWEHVRKLLGRCSLHAFAQPELSGAADAGQDLDRLAHYTGMMADLLCEEARGGRAAAPGNSYGESVADLALSLVAELQSRPGDWLALCAALRPGPFPWAEALLRKKVNDMYAVLRDKVDADNYQAACGRLQPEPDLHLSHAGHGLRRDPRAFAAWMTQREQVGAILGRTVDAMPIEVRQMKSIAHCKPEWIIAWSASLERFGDGPGPLHTRSKRFASLKNSPGKIAAMLAEIGDYEELSSEPRPGLAA
ncbi:hypothetical protein LP420_01900 [Massilia sp. B-10]|nr:hypothetical protein LP420_01900 [Massilia sp. B-10]